MQSHELNRYPGWPSPDALRGFAAESLAHIGGSPIGYWISGQAIQKVEKLRTGDELSATYRSLRDPLTSIRSAYRTASTERRPVELNYSGSTALAYCAGYLSPYVDLARWCITRSLDPSTVGDALNIGIVGPGPCPELVALLHLLSATELPCSRVKLRLFDAHHKAWRPVRNAVISEAQKLFPGISVTAAETKVGIGTDDAFTAPSERPQFDVVIGQNFLNEGVSSAPHLIGNLNSIFDRLKPGGTMMIADQFNDSARAGLDRLSAWRRDDTSTTFWRSTHIKSESPDWKATPELKHLFETMPSITPRINTRFAAVRVTKNVV